MTISELPDRVFINDPKTYSDGETTPGTWTIKPDWCFKHEYRRADLPPTLSAAMELPEVQAMVDAIKRCPPDRPQMTDAELRAAVNEWWRLWARPALAAIKETKT